MALAMMHSPAITPLFLGLVLWIALVSLPEKSNAFQSTFGRARTPTSRQQQTLAPLSSSSSSSSDNNDNDFMASLRSQIEKVEDQETKMPIVALDSMLPRQVLKMEVTNDAKFLDLVKERLVQETPWFGMVGMATLSKTGQTLPLQNGVQVEIVGNPVAVKSGLRLTLKAGRRFRITGEFTQVEPQGWSEARVHFLNTKQEEQEEEEGSADQVLSIARAKSRAREFTSPNMQMPDNASLVERWIELAKQNERNPGQIDELLRDLGEIPNEDEPASERAFWIGALINPLPGMGVAMEIRPQLLMARSAEERVLVALQGILASIKHMDGSAPLF